jgi:hypothetical protein
MAQNSEISNNMVIRRTLRLNEHDINVLPKPGSGNSDVECVSRFRLFVEFPTYQKVESFIQTSQIHKIFRKLR